MGLNGAFLTGDLFNLFVFFEVLLAASYGLLLHGSGRARVSAGLHYVSINVATSLLFLIGASLIYGVTGTLNIADLAVRIPATPASDWALLQSGLGILGVAFLIKAAMWPVGFWLPRTYSAASPPVAALFAILSKVGVYAVLRVWLLAADATPASEVSPHDPWLLFGGLATIVFGTLGVLASKTLSRLAGCSLLISSGILLATISIGGEALPGALFYLVSSTLAVGALYLLIEPIARTDADIGPALASDPVFEDEIVAASDEEEEEVGVVIPAPLAILGGGFLLCALLLAGLPPLSGFLAKFAIIHGLLKGGAGIDAATGWLIALIIASGLATIIAASRAGIDLLWTSDRSPRPLRLAEAAPVAFLLTLCVGLTVLAGPVMGYMDAAARALPDGRVSLR
jgi:multicomponent K+:H+ antiporter subunit D